MTRCRVSINNGVKTVGGGNSSSIVVIVVVVVHKGEGSGKNSPRDSEP